VKTLNSGIVKWFDKRKGYGFIAIDDSNIDAFVHYNAIEKKNGTIVFLEKNDKVQFELKETSKGNEARKVIVVKKFFNAMEDLSKWVEY
jgi:CspA family cold shock protein